MRITKLLSAGAVALALIACGEESDTAVQEEVGGMELPSDDEMTDFYSESEQYTEQDDAPTYSDVLVYGPNDIIQAISDRDQQVQLILTPSHLSMKLSSESMHRLRSHVNKRGLKDDLKVALLASIQEIAQAELEDAVTDQRTKPSKHRIRYPLHAVNSMHFYNGRLWIDLEKEMSLSFDDIRTADGRPVLANFDEWDAEALVEAFESI
jgi:hypothetical protein